MKSNRPTVADILALKGIGSLHIKGQKLAELALPDHLPANIEDLAYQNYRQVGAAAVAAAGIGQLAGCLLRQRDQLRHRTDAQRRVHGQAGVMRNAAARPEGQTGAMGGGEGGYLGAIGRPDGGVVFKPPFPVRPPEDFLGQFFHAGERVGLLQRCEQFFLGDEATADGGR